MHLGIWEFSFVLLLIFYLNKWSLCLHFYLHLYSLMKHVKSEFLSGSECYTSMYPSNSRFSYNYTSRAYWKTVAYSGICDRWSSSIVNVVGGGGCHRKTNRKRGGGEKLQGKNLLWKQCFPLHSPSVNLFKEKRLSTLFSSWSLIMKIIFPFPILLLPFPPFFFFFSKLWWFISWQLWYMLLWDFTPPW